MSDGDLVGPPPWHPGGVRLTNPGLSPSGLALIATTDAWSVRALGSVLEPAGYRVLRATTGAEARDGARSARPDFILIAPQVGDGSGVELCRELRQDPEVTSDTAIIGMTSAATREERLNWLRAGASACVGFPFEGEELLLKLAWHVQAKRDADHARALALVDGPTGLYNRAGLQRRARELVAGALRLHSAMACVAFGTDPRPEARAVTQARLGRLLRASARLSDTIGWWKPTDFVVLAPTTNAAGAERLARRLSDAIEAASPESRGSFPAFEVRAGYHAVADVHATPVEAEDLLDRAGKALAVARSAQGGARIQRFEAER
jgi:PleD family two-component response regulator